MDVTNRRPQLPALSYLDVDKVKREEEVAYQSRKTGTTQSLSTSAGASPTYQYPPGPPPPYSHAHGPPAPVQTTNAWPSSHTPAKTPPERRWSSENEKDGAKQTTRQSLPSISEALGVESQTTFAPAPTPPAASSLHTSSLLHPTSTAAASPRPDPRRSRTIEPSQGPPSSYSTSNGHSYFPQYRSESSKYQSQPPVVEAPRSRAAYPPIHESKSSLPPPQVSQSTPTMSQLSTYPRAPEPPSAHDRTALQPSSSMGPPSTFSYGYTPYPPRYSTSTSTPTSGTGGGPIYQPSTTYGAPQPNFKSESSSKFEDNHGSQATYGDNVKRHLDFYDLEMSLNEVATTSGILADFSRRYGDRMHQTQRSGATLSTLPSIVEVDDMVAKSRVQLDSLLKIRDVIIEQQAVYEQQAADRQKQQQKAFSEAPQPQAEHQPQEADELKPNGFASVDTKKRRGRAAPPGRCHSCNRAETPEWRRGPDGARTLCNACGLHYAKLTRKNNGVKATGNVGSSNIRPKENMSQ